MDGIAGSLSGINVAAQAYALSANNIANVTTGGYRAQSLQQQALQGGGVEATGIQASQAATVPGGSNVDLATEAVNQSTQGGTYQANLKFAQVQQQLLGSALDMKA